MISYVFDAGAVLGIANPSAEPLPTPAPGFAVLRVPGGLSLQALRDSPSGRELLWQQDWYWSFGWYGEALPPGTYHLRIPVPLSERRNVWEHEEMLRSQGEALAPAALAAAASLCLATAGAQPFAGWVRCVNEVSPGHRVELAWHDGRLLLAEGGDTMRHPNIRAASVRLT